MGNKSSNGKSMLKRQIKIESNKRERQKEKAHFEQQLVSQFYIKNVTWVSKGTRERERVRSKERKKEKAHYDTVYRQLANVAKKLTRVRKYTHM